MVKEQKPWANNDGWDQDYFEGFLDLADEMHNTAYAIRSSTRHSSFGFEDLILSMRDVVTQLGFTIDNFEDDLDEYGEE